MSSNGPSQFAMKAQHGRPAKYEATTAIYQANAWMCHRITMAAFTRGTAPAPGSDTYSIPKTDYIAPHPLGSYAVTIDLSGKLYWGKQ